MVHHYSFPVSVLFIFLLISFSNNSNAQGENNVWTFGYHNGLDFNVSPPVFIQTSTESVEGSGSISDANGNLIFYSNSNNAWDRNGNLMPNGSGLLGNDYTSTSQATVIVRLPADSNKYYLFSLGSSATVNSGKLFYNVVDMTLNNGLGDVVPSAKNILLDTMMTEQMIVAKGKCGIYWLISHKNNAPVYCAYKIDASGIHTPVLSIGLGTWTDHAGGEMKISKDGHKIGSPYGAGNNNKGFELSLFNETTGIVSGAIAIDDTPPYNAYYGLAFSPDGSKVYVAGIAGELSQFDISAYPNASAINATEYTFPDANMGGTMRMGPDDRIYIARANSIYITRIDNPNASGIAANVDPQALSQPGWSLYPPNYDYTGFGLGNAVVGPVSIEKDTLFNSSSLKLCDQDTLIVSADSTYVSFTWNDGSHNLIKQITAGGTYWVYNYNECQVAVDSFIVSTIMPSFSIREDDTTICTESSITLHADLLPAGNYQWNTGASASTIIVDTTGLYIAKGTNECGSFSDSVKINTQSCDCAILIPSSFSPNGDGLNDGFEIKVKCTLSTFNLHVFNRFGQRVYHSSKPEDVWDGSFKGKASEMGTYFYYLSYADAKGNKKSKKGDLLLLR